MLKSIPKAAQGGEALHEEEPNWMHALSPSLQVHPGCEGTGLVCRGPEGSAWEGHGQIPQCNSSKSSPPLCKHRVLHMSFRSICLSSSKSQIFHNPLLSALKEVNSVSMTTTRSLYNFVCVFLKSVAKILSLEG